MFLSDPARNEPFFREFFRRDSDASASGSMAVKRPPIDLGPVE